MSAAGVAALVGTTSRRVGRRHRQEVSQDIAAVAAKDPSLLAGHIDALVDALTTARHRRAGKCSTPSPP